MPPRIPQWPAATQPVSAQTITTDSNGLVAGEIKIPVKDGEISADEAEKKRSRVKLQSLGRPSHIRGFADLPEGLQKLIEESFSLHDRIVQLDLAMMALKPTGEVAAVTVNPVGAQIHRLERAFGAKIN